MRISLLAIAWSLSALSAAAAQSADATVELVVPAGRPLRVALDGTLTVKRVGQPVTATSGWAWGAVLLSLPPDSLALRHF